MSPRREIKSKDFLGDVRRGMTQAALMEKYGLSPTGFRRVVQSIVEFQTHQNKASVEKTPKELRRAPRKSINFPLWVYEGIDQIEHGRVLDLSENGVRVQGLPARVGDECPFIARARSAEKDRPFVFDAVCRWTRKGEGKDGFTAGFEITYISGSDANRLKALLQ